VPRHAHLAGFDLHANVAVPATDRARLEQLCRYLLRPAVAQDRLRQLRRRPRGAHAEEPLGGWHAPAALRAAHAAGEARGPDSASRTHLVVYHGVLAPHSGRRARVVAYGTPPAVARPCSEASDTSKSAPRHWAWAAPMRRTFRPRHAGALGRGALLLGHSSGPALCSGRKSRDTLVVRAVPGGRSGGSGLGGG
jgi:hypothetical protein